MEKDNRANRYSPETRARAVRMVLDNQGNYESQSAAIKAIAPKIGCGRDTLRRWVQQEETDMGCRDGVTSEERARIKDLEREVRELRQANELFKKGEPMERQWSERHWRMTSSMSRPGRGSSMLPSPSTRTAPVWAARVFLRHGLPLRGIPGLGLMP